MIFEVSGFVLSRTAARKIIQLCTVIVNNHVICEMPHQLHSFGYCQKAIFLQIFSHMSWLLHWLAQI
jgi:hypothetical protein